MPDGDVRYTIVYQEALRAIADQQAAVDALQTRAGTVAAGGTIATSLIGLGAANSGSLGVGGFAAVIFLLGIVLLTGAILWPHRDWRFIFEASRLHWNYIEGPHPLDANLMKRDLALYLEAYHRANSPKIDRFGVMLSGAIVLLFLEIGAVLLEIWRS
jgi:hypothetical protein